MIMMSTHTFRELLAVRREISFNRLISYQAQEDFLCKKQRGLKNISKTAAPALPNSVGQ
jgi:hypothetical protein